MDVPEHASRLTLELIAAYRAAHYRVDELPVFTLTVDLHCPELQRLMRNGGDAGAAFITAWNPLGALLEREQNERRQERLIEELRQSGLRWMPGVGSDPGSAWQDEEASVLVLGLDRIAACEWGRRYEQNAVLWAGINAIPRLLLLR